MTKIHVVEVTIVNNLNVDLTYVDGDDWFDSGRVADDNAWPKTITRGSTVVVKCYEKDWALAGCSGWVKYTVDGVVVYFAFSNPTVGTNGIDIGVKDDVWNSMSSNYYPISRCIQLQGSNWLSAYVQSTDGDTNTATYTLNSVDVSVITPANLTLDDVRAVFSRIPPQPSYRKYFKGNDSAPTDINSFFYSHFKGIAVYAGKFIFSHTNVEPDFTNKSGSIIIADNLPGPEQAQTEGSYDTMHPGWPHPCSSQACGSFMALGIQLSAESPGSDESEIEILDIRPTAVNQSPVLLGIIPRPKTSTIPNNGSNGVGMTKEVGIDGKYLVATVNGNDLTFYKSHTSSLLVNGQPSTGFDQVLRIDNFAESGAGLALLTQTDGAIFLLTLNSDAKNVGSKACLYGYNNTATPSLTARLAEIDLPVPDMSDSVSRALIDMDLLVPILGPLAANILNLAEASTFNSSFRWGKGLAITSSSSIELYASDRDIMPLSSIPVIGTDKDFSVVVWKAGDGPKKS